MKPFSLAVVVGAIALLAGCAGPAPIRTSLPAQWLPSVNADQRRPNFVIIHHTTNDRAEDALRTLRDPLRQVSAHYLVGRDGSLYQLVDERLRAWHAGDSWWGGQTDINSASIGIELDNNGREPFAEPLVNTLLALLADIKQRHRIPVANFLGHADVAPRRKVDPSRLFPWRTLAARGFGLWCEPPYPPAPAGFDPVAGLQAFGYHVGDPAAAVAAFRRHFVPEENGNGNGGGLNAAEQARLYCLVQRRRGDAP